MTTCTWCGLATPDLPAHTLRAHGQLPATVALEADLHPMSVGNRQSDIAERIMLRVAEAIRHLRADNPGGYL